MVPAIDTTLANAAGKSTCFTADADIALTAERSNIGPPASSHCRGTIRPHYDAYRGCFHARDPLQRSRSAL